MANFSATDVKKLRELTGAGMLDCKKALDEADGDFDRAVEVLRIKGAAKAAKRGEEREAGAGLVASSGGALVELKSETDFVAKNEDFIAAARRIAEAADRAHAGDPAALAAATLDDGSTVGDLVQHLAVTIGEKIELGRVAWFDGSTVVYLHKRAADLPPAIGVLVAYDGAEPGARDVAQQIAAMRPSFLTQDEVPAATVAKEREIAEAAAREEGKPEQAIPRIVDGRVNAYYKDHVLLDQPSVKEPKRSVQAVLADAGTDVTRFARFEVGVS